MSLFLARLASERTPRRTALPAAECKISETAEPSVKAVKP